MPVPSKIDNHYDQIEEVFPVQFKDKPNIDAVLQNIVEKVQDIEDLFWSIFEGTKFFKAKGVNLDRYGFVLGKPRPAGLSDEKYFILLAGEIIARSSDATVDGIRKRIEAVLGVFKTNIILINNTLNWRNLDTYPDLTGSVFVYGYTQDSTRRLTGTEGDMLKAACPITTSVAVYGQHLSLRSLRLSTSSLWIPCEIVLEPDQVAVQDPGPTLDDLVTVLDEFIGVRANNFKTYGKGWENGRLAEEGAFAEDALIDSSDAEDYFEIEDADWVDLLLLQSEGFSTDRGVLLEISTSN